MNRKLSAKCTLWVNRFLALTMIFLLFSLPWLFSLYCRIRALVYVIQQAVLISFYTCFPVIMYALWCIDRLVSNILADRIFIPGNVSFLRRLRWCCAGISLITACATFFYFPLVFLSVVMGFLALAVSVMVNVLAAAVAIREENDLTI